MLSLPTRGVYIFSSVMVLVGFVAIDESFWRWLFDSSELVVEERSQQKKPSRPVEMVAPPEPEKAPEPEKLVEPEKAPEPERPVEPEPPVRLEYKSAPQVSVRRKKAEPLPQRRREEVEETAKGDLKLKDELPEKEAADFERMVAQGIKMRKTGIEAPGYRAMMEPELIDNLQARGLIQLFVFNNRTGAGGFLFSGGLSRPGKVRIAQSQELAGFSGRMVPLDRARGRRLLGLVGQEFKFSTSDCVAVILFRSDIDAMVLASQDAAARKTGIAFKDVTMTKGKFITSKGIPFNYRISEIEGPRGWVKLQG